MPMAVINGARRGALRKGRYAMRSMVMLMPPMISITTGNTTTMAIRLTAVNDPSSMAKKPRIAALMYPPIVNTSPWAKLISSMMP